MIITDNGSFYDGKRKYVPWRHWKYKYLWSVNIICDDKIISRSVMAKNPIQAAEASKAMSDMHDDFLDEEPELEKTGEQ